MRSYPELEARLREIKDSGYPHGYIGNSGVIGGEVQRYDGIMPETEARYIQLTTYLDSLRFPKDILLDSSPQDHVEALLSGIDEDQAERLNLAKLLNRKEWHFRLQPFMRFRLLRDPHANSTLFYIKLADYLFENE